MSRAWWRNGCGVRSRASPLRSTRVQNASRSRSRSGYRPSNSRASPSPTFSSAPTPRSTKQKTTAATAWWRRRRKLRLLWRSTSHIARCHSPRKRGIQYAAVSRFSHQRLWNTGSPAFAGDDGSERTLFDAGRALLRDASRFSLSILPINLNPRIPEQHARGVFCGARHRRIVPHPIGGDGAIDEKLELRGEFVRMGDIELQQPVAEPGAAAVLEGDRDLSDSMILSAHFGNRVDERAAAKALIGEAALQPVEGAENLFCGRLVGGRNRPEPALEIGRYQLVLRRKVVVERALGDADFGRDGIDADGADALQIEQPVGGFEDPLLHGRLCGGGHDYTDLCSFCLDNAAPQNLITQIGVIKP